MENINTIKKMMQEKGIKIDEKLEKIIQNTDDYEVFKNGIDLIAKNTGLQYEDIECVIDWLGYDLDEEKEKELYEDYLSISGVYNNYIELNNGWVLYYNE